ncbi:conserved hypothetical protein [Pediculus humanus corporis]|uniref:Uncharacterized protein n=1 Tax=Pediculus humanus subsp. corporis TaxID=121224 RepID=E0V9G9_PEDHC|nr:uncharacterized protein Phum_PHUM011740 [Pediculus humanus corporis]EEB10025.1 conserved hypothetical protein [Pediculus humanus corporis]
MYGEQNSRDSYSSSGYFYKNKKKNSSSGNSGGTLFFDDNSNNNNDSPLINIEPVNKDGKPNKELIILKMTEKLKNPELKNFIQESVEECFQILNDNNNNERNDNNNNNTNKVCKWAKNFAMCMEIKGKDVSFIFPIE